MLASAVSLLSVSCSSNGSETESARRVTLPRFVQSDFVSFESGTPQERVSVEQTLEIVPQVILRRGALVVPNVVEKPREVGRGRATEPEPPIFWRPTEVDDRERAFSVRVPSKGEIPLITLPSSDEAPSPKIEEEGTNKLKMSDVALLVGSLSIIMGATSLANGSGEEGPGVFGFSMLGVGLASYTAGGILAWRERSSPPSPSGSSITLGPGLTLRGNF